MKYPDISRLIKKQRKIKDATLNDLEQFVGVTASYLSQVENGNKLPSEKVLFTIAYFLGMGSDISNKFEENLIKEYASIKKIDKNIALDRYNQFCNNLIKQIEKSFNKSENTVLENKFRLKKGTLEVEVLKEPYFDLEWLLTQDEYEVFYGRDYNIKGSHSGKKSKLDEMFAHRLRDEDIKIIRDLIHAYISNRYDKKKKVDN